LRKRSHKNEEIALRAILEREASGFAKKTLDALSPEDFAKYVRKRLERVKPGTLRRELNPLRHMFGIAPTEWGLPVQNPIVGLDLPPDGPHRERVLTWAERPKIYQAIESCCRGLKQRRFWVAFVRTALATGMRRGEQLKLEWRDVDFEAMRIHLRAENTKSSRPRLLPLTRNLASYLRRYQTTLNEPDKAAEARVFNLTNSAAEQAWRRIRNRAGVEDLHLHDLKHTAGTSFLAKPIDLSAREHAFMLDHKYDGVSRAGRIYNNPVVHELVESIRAKLEAADDLFDAIETVDDVAFHRHFSLDEGYPDDFDRGPWPDVNWTKQSGRVVMDKAGPKSREFIAQEAAERAKGIARVQQIEDEYGSPLPLLSRELVSDLLAMGPEDRRRACDQIVALAAE
jgi:integrase